jgi:regulatory protein
MAVDQPSLKGRALRLLSAARALARRAGAQAAALRRRARHLAQALDELQAKGFISEQRVLESVLHRRSAKLGTQRIRQELQSKGLAPEAVLQAVEQLRATEVDRAREVWRKKFGAPPVDAAERAKQMRFLASRGFGGEVIRKVVAGACDDE